MTDKASTGTFKFWRGGSDKSQIVLLVSGDWDRLTTLGMFLGNDFADGASVVFELLFIFPRKCGKSSFFLSEPHQPILKC